MEERFEGEFLKIERNFKIQIFLGWKKIWKKGKKQIWKDSYKKYWKPIWVIIEATSLEPIDQIFRLSERSWCADLERYPSACLEANFETNLGAHEESCMEGNFSESNSFSRFFVIITKILHLGPWLEELLVSSIRSHQSWKSDWHKSAGMEANLETCMGQSWSTRTQIFGKR